MRYVAIGDSFTEGIGDELPDGSVRGWADLVGEGRPGASFTSGSPWIGINPDHVEVNAAAQLDDPDSVLVHHRRLIELRHTDPVVTEGDFELLLPA